MASNRPFGKARRQFGANSKGWDFRGEGNKQEGRTNQEAHAAIMARLKKFLPRSLFGRAVMISLIPLVLLQLVASYIFFERHWDTVARYMALSLAGEITSIIKLISAFPDNSDQDFILSTARASMGLDTRIEPGTALPAARPESRFDMIKPVLTRVFAAQFTQPFRIDTDSLPKHVIIGIQLDDSVLYITVPRKRVFSSTTYIFIMWMVGASIVLFTITIFFLHKQAQPIRRLGRVLILGGSEYVVEAQLMYRRIRDLDVTRRPDFYNFVSRETDVLDILAENFGPRTFGNSQVIGHNGLDIPGTRRDARPTDWIDLQIDSAELQGWMAERNFDIAGDRPGNVWDHWYYYTYRGNMKLYRKILRDRPTWDIARLRDDGIPDGISKRWSLFGD